MYDEEEEPWLEIVGVGATGAAVVNHLHQLALYNVNLFICHTDANLLRASPVPNKVLFEADRADDDAKWHLADALNEWETPGRLVILVTDLNSPADCRMATTLVQIFKEQGKFTIPAVSLLDETGPPKWVTGTLTGLQQQADSVWVYIQEPEAYPHRIDQLATAVSTLAKFCESLTDAVDFQDFKKVVKSARMAVASAKGEGIGRATDVVDILVEQLRAQTMGGPVIDRILIITSSSGDRPLLLREQVAVTRGISDFVGREVKLFKFGSVTDAWLGDWLDVVILIGMPVQ